MLPLERTSAFRQLTGTRAAWLTVAFFVAFSAAALWVPLLQLPGYELAEALSLLTALLAAPLVVSLLVRDRAPSPVRAALAAGAWLSLLDLAAILVVGLHAALGTRCSPLTGLPFALLLPFPSAFLGATLAAGSAALVPNHKGGATVLYALCVLALLGHAAWGGYFGPEAFGYDHLLGYFPGPLYDDALKAQPALFWFRGLSLGFLAAGLLSLTVAPRLTLPGLAFLLWASSSLEHDIGARSSTADLDRALGYVRSSDGLTIHAPRELDGKRLEQLWHAAAISRAQVAEALGIPESTRVDVFFHRSPEQKAILTGAGQTHFTKPWLGQIQTEVDAPHVLRHEMVHALAAAIGGGPFGVGQRLFFNIGIVEGLAEAVDWPAERYTLDEWSAALQSAHELPEPKTLLDGSARFYATPQAQAYAVAGAFLHWLLVRHGKAAVSALYRSENFNGAIGESLPRLSDEFDLFLSEAVVSPQLAHAAAERFRQRPLFARPCARELADLRDEASQAEGRGETQRASELFARCAALDPSDPRYLEGRWRSLREARAPEATNALADLLASPATDDAVRARVAVDRGDQAALGNRADEARADFREAQELGLDPPHDRAVQIRLLALETPELAEPLQRYFEKGPEGVSLLGLSEAAERHPAFGPLRYLLGLALASRGEPGWSLSELDKALGLGLPDDLIAQALRVELDDAIRERRYEVAAETVARLMPFSKTPAAQRQAEDLMSELRIERRLFEVSPLPP